MTGSAVSRTMIWLVENAVLVKASATVIMIMFVPNGSTVVLVGDCVMTSGPDRSAAKMKFVPVTSGMDALQFVSSESARLVKLHEIAGGVVSRTMTTREMAL